MLRGGGQRGVNVRECYEIRIILVLSARNPSPEQL